MKARLLTKLLNDTRYTVNNNSNYIAVGSPLCHDLISVDKKTLKIKYALDTWKKGRESLTDRTNDELLFIWDKLQELIDNGEIHDIIEGEDEIENPLPIFTVYDGKLIESVTDKYGWPNTTIDGYIMYENTYFPTKEQAIKYGVRECESTLKYAITRLEEVGVEVKRIQERIDKYKNYIDHLKSI